MRKGVVSFLLTLLLTAVVHPVALAAPPSRIEIAVNSAAYDAHLVRASYVSLYAPAPASFGPRPAACDRLGHLRFRSAAGPLDFRNADAILVGMPGLQGGATLMDRIARNTIRRAAQRGKHIEFWSLDRRANCFEDHRGLRAARAAKNPSIGPEYYFHGAKIDGHRYAGPPDEEGRAFLSHLGLAQTLRDWRTVIAQVPAADRQRKVLCGGHSLGSRLTGAFARWDFDGNPATTVDAGYRQCAAYFSIDQRLREEQDLQVALSALPVGLGAAGGAVGTAAPYTEPVSDPLIALSLATVAAEVAPKAESRLGERLPRTGSTELLMRLLLSPDLVSFLTGTRQLRDFRFTNEAALGAVYDDNSQSLGILRVSLGAFTGGPVNRKEFPAPNGLPNVSGLVGANTLVAPARTRDEGGPLYRWISSSAVRSPLDSQGRPYTSRSSEVTDIRDFARLAAESPADFWEWYFPTRLLTDTVAEAAGDRSGDLRNSMHDGVSKHPTLYIDAGDGVEGSADAPSGPPGTRRILLPGYNHIDPSTASYLQPGGRPERASLELARFAVVMTR